MADEFIVPEWASAIEIEESALQTITVGEWLKLSNLLRPSTEWVNDWINLFTRAVKKWPKGWGDPTDTASYDAIPMVAFDVMREKVSETFGEYRKKVRSKPTTG